MPIQYAGVDLLLEDPGGCVRRWLERYLPLAGLQLFGELAASVGSRNNPRSGVKEFTALPTWNYPPAPPLRLNTLYWPTGAARWGRGLFLTDDAGLQDITTALGSSGDPAKLKFWDDDTTNPSSAAGVFMYLLPSRPISAFDGTGEEDDDTVNRLWLLPLVDQRYWWQYRQFDGTVTSWDALLESLRTTLDLQSGWTDAVDAAYGFPHNVEMKRKNESAALMLDAAAACIGKRFVLDTDATGTVQDGILKGFSAAETALASDLTLGEAAGIILGGDLSDHEAFGKPESISVVFPAADGDSVGDTKTASLSGEVADTVKIFHESADVGENSSSWRQALADQIAADFDGWSAKLHDFTLAGIVRWRPTGFDNYTEWSVGERLKSGRYRMQTRVCSLPYNFGVENLCHQKTAAGSDGGSSGGSGGCCAPCIDRKWMVIGGKFARRYKVRRVSSALIPAGDLAGSDLATMLLHYIGMAGVSPSPSLTGVTDGSDYWESDTFERACKDINGCERATANLCVTVWCASGDSVPDSPPGPGFGVSCSGEPAWGDFAGCSGGATCPAPDRDGSYSGETVVLECDGAGAILFAGNYTDAWAYYTAHNGSGDCQCSDSTTFTFTLPSDPTVEVTLEKTSDCVWSASGADWSASFDISTGILTLSWDAGACTAEYTLANLADLDADGSFTLDKTDESGDCDQPDTLEMTGIPGDVVDTYLWRLVLDSENNCRAGHHGWLYLVKVAGENCDDFTVWNCEIEIAYGTMPNPVVQYKNREDFRPRCGNTFQLQLPQLLNKDLEALLACSVCVFPAISDSPVNECLTNLKEPLAEIDDVPVGRFPIADGLTRSSDFPAVLGAEIISSTISHSPSVVGNLYGLEWGEPSGDQWNSSEELELDNLPASVSGHDLPSQTFSGRIIVTPYCARPVTSSDGGISGADRNVLVISIEPDAHFTFIAGTGTVGNLTGEEYNVIVPVSDWSALDVEVTLRMQLNYVSPSSRGTLIGEITIRIYE